MQDEVAEILRDLAGMNRELFSKLSGLSDLVASLTWNVEKATSGIDVHERTKAMSDGMLADLEQIVAQSRQIKP